jgi:hypothetical protein
MDGSRVPESDAASLPSASGPPSPWRRVGASITGSSHEAKGSPCQDSHALEVISTPQGEVLICAVADGAGSASLSARGSRIACDTAIELAQRYLDSDPRLTHLTDDVVHRWVDECATRVEAAASAMDAPLRDFACTLLLAVVGERRACFAQLGDGGIVAEHTTILDAVTWPQNGEFANTTLFITDPKDRADLQVSFVDGAVGDIALFTDGVELLALRLQQRRPHVPFFATLFESVRSLGPGNAPEAEQSLGDFLSSDPVRARTDDDMTLVLASRRAPGSVLISRSTSTALVRVEPRTMPEVVRPLNT